MNRVHLCCGDVYLKDYVNVDRVGSIAVREMPGTTLDQYYTHPVHENGEAKIDVWMDIEKEWLFPAEGVDEFVMISAFEHFSRESAEKIIEKVHTSLKYGGEFKFDFPDLKRTLDEYSADPEYMMRLIYGSQKNAGAFHRWGYTAESIYEKLKKHHWREIHLEPIVKHAYPMIGVRAVK